MASINLDGLLANDTPPQQISSFSVMSHATPEGFSTNFTRNQTTAEIQNDLIHNIFVQIVITVLYIIIFVLGIFGNFLVSFVVLRQKSMQNVTNFFIANLAIADILLCLFCLPFTPMYSFNQRWIFGSIMCHMLPFVQGFCVYLSTLTLTSIAIDRFFVIIFPFRPRMKLTTCYGIIVGIWCIAFTGTFLYAYYMKLHTVIILNVETLLCEEAWPSETFRRVYGTLTFILQFIIPCLVISFCYICIFYKLKYNKKKLSKTKNSKKQKNTETIISKKRTTNKMLFAMVLIFAVCWVPLNFVNIVEDYSEKFNQTEYYNILFFITHLIAMSSTNYNIILYSWLNENFRKEFRLILPCFFLKISGNGEIRRSVLMNVNIQDNDMIRNDKSTFQSMQQKSMDNGDETKDEELSCTNGDKCTKLQSGNSLDEIILTEVIQAPKIFTKKNINGILETSIG